MTATGNEVVLLKQLKDYGDTKLNAPASAGTNGQMLVYGDDGNQWIDVPEGTAYSADNATLQLSGTQFSVKDGGITADKIAAGTITADKLTSGVIPDTSGFLTTAAAAETYQPKGDYLTSVPSEYLTQTEGDAAYQPKGEYANASHTHTVSQITDFPEIPEIALATDAEAKGFLGY